MNSLENLGKFEIDGETFFPINSDTFIVSGPNSVFSYDSNGKINKLFDLPEGIETVVGNYVVYLNGTILELDLGNKKYKELQKITRGEASSCGPYVFSTLNDLYKLKMGEFKKIYETNKYETFQPIPIMRYDKLKAAKHIDMLNMSIDLLLIVIDYMVPELS